MMQRALQLHPDSRCDAVTSIDVEIARLQMLTMDFRVAGDIGKLRIPPRNPALADELWRSTCFEAFVRAVGREGYYEFNFAPSGQWAAYRFKGYRAGRTILHEMGSYIRTDPAEDFLTLRAGLLVSELRDLQEDARLQIGLSAVIEETNGRLSYWALRHPPGKPDFHHPDCFALELAPASGA